MSVVTGTRLILVRHAEADNPASRLTELGRQQAQLLAARMVAMHRRWPITAVYATYATAVTQTASICATALDLPLIGGLVESDPRHTETYAAYTKRAVAEVLMLAERHPRAAILVIAHNETVAATNGYFSGASGDANHYTGVTIWDYQGKWSTVCHNDTRHLLELATH